MPIAASPHFFGENSGPRRTEQEAIAAILSQESYGPFSNNGLTCGQVYPIAVSDEYLGQGLYQVTHAWRTGQDCYSESSGGPQTSLGYIYVTKDFTCPSDYYIEGQPWTLNPEPYCTIPTNSTYRLEDKNLGPCPQNTCHGNLGQAVFNPVNSGTGNKYQSEVDYVGTLPFKRFYSSATNFYANNLIGKHWHHSYQRSIRLISQSTASTAFVHRENGRVYHFTLLNTLWNPDSDITDKLIRLTDGNGNPTGWEYTNSDDEVETYDASGKLLSIKNRAGLTQTLEYDTSNRLIKVTDAFGRFLQFTYDTSNRIATMTDPANGVYTYAYDSNNNLSSVTYPDTRVRTYHYDNTTFIHALTGITDENNNRYATWTYDAQGRAISSSHAGNVEGGTLVYNTDGTTTVTDALGTSRTYSFQTILGVVKNTGITQPCSSCGGSSSAITYDANGNVASRTDFKGNVTTYTYDLTRNLETSRTEAFGTSLARTITTQWHSTYRLPLSITEPTASGTRVTSFTYDTSGNLTQKTITAGALTRTWNYTYNTHGQVLTIDGPRSDVTDVMTYTYYAANDSTIAKRGQLATVTNALSQTTQITSYDLNGRPLSITDSNNVVTNLTYDPRGRLTSKTVSGELTSYTYDDVGNLTRVTLPNTSYLDYTYDAAHRLTRITDHLGNRIDYTLDAMGNRTAETIKDPNGNLVQTRSRVFNALNQLFKDIGAQTQTTQYTYDLNGNLTQTTDPLNHSNTQAYDALNRLIAQTDPNSGITSYAYDSNDQLTTVTDPKGLITTYTYDGLGNQTQLTSPDTGITQMTYDVNGNLKTQTDARNKTTTYTYDALNRVTQIAYADATQASFEYDQGTNAKGRLNKVTDITGLTQWSYDPLGRITGKTQTIGSLTKNIAYTYDSQGKLTQMTYPSGKVIQYTYTNGQITGLTVNGQTLLNNINYQPASLNLNTGLGNPKSWTWGNGTTHTRSFDQDGRLNFYTLGNSSKTLLYDAASRILSNTDNTNTNYNQDYGYDNLDRLISFIPVTDAQHNYTYDANGNRLSQTLGANTYTYSYPSTNQKLSSITGPQAKTYTYDASGNQTNDGAKTYTYDARGRLVQIDNDSFYLINGLGQRVKKTTPDGVTSFFYDDAGKLIAEISGNHIKEYVYLNDNPVAVLTGTN